MKTRLLDASDSEQIEAYLSTHASTAMFLRSNLRNSPMTTSPRERYEGAYVGVFDAGELVGVVGHFWNGMILMQADAGLEQAARNAVNETGLKLTGMSGPLEQVDRLSEHLDLSHQSRKLDSAEYLYDLALDDLIVPELSSDPSVRCRPPSLAEFDVLVEWRRAYLKETLNDVSVSPDAVRHHIENGDWRVLEIDGDMVALTGFNATLPDIVQVGGVYTPPELRGRGYARTVVAAHLHEAHTEGVERGILFTAHDNEPAQRAYEAIGFRRIGDYGLLLFEEPITLS